MPCPPARRGSLAGPQRVLPGFPAAVRGARCARSVLGSEDLAAIFRNWLKERGQRQHVPSSASTTTPQPETACGAASEELALGRAPSRDHSPPPTARPAPSRRLLPALAPGSARGQRGGAGAAPQAPPPTPDRLRRHLRGTVPRRSLLRCAPLPPRLPREKVRAGREDAGPIPPPVAVGCWWEPGRAACKPEHSLGGEPYSYLLTFLESTYVVPVLLSAYFYSRLVRHCSYLICGSLLGLAI